MAPMSEEDIEWFKSTFHPIPKPELPEDCIEYSIYRIPKNSAEEAADEAVASRAALTKVQKLASELVKQYLKDYIWQRDSFKLELTKEDGVSLLRGRSVFGDSIEDEWVIVYILRELTRQIDDIWVKVTDSDGEFLLVEAAATLPAWLEPDVANNRVWIHNGELVIIKPKSADKVIEKLSFRDTKKIITTESNRLMRSTSIEEEAFYRLRNYPDQISKNMHSSFVTVPRVIAYLLHLKPAYISPAVEAFYLRDPISLKVLHSKEQSVLRFEPKDLVTVSAKFTKVGFAQLKSQDFDAPKHWRETFSSESGSKEYNGAEMGMKLTCGFEMLLFDPQNEDKAVVREIKLVLDDIATGDEQLPTDEDIDRNWDKTEDDESWLDINFEDLERELKGGKEKGVKPKTGADFGDKSAQENLQRIVAQFEDFLNDDTAGFEGADFFNESDDSEVDDQDDDLSSDGEDKEASFDEEQFSKMMREMMGLPSSTTENPVKSQGLARIEELESDSEEYPKRPVGSSPEMAKQPKPGAKASDFTDLNRALREELQHKRQGLKGDELDFSEEEKQEDENSEAAELKEIEELSRQMEAELKKAGVLDPNGAIREEESQRRNRTLKGKAPIRDINDADESDEEEYDDSNVDINLAKNLLESLRSQGGAAGPGSNLLGLMGAKIPKDDRG